MLEQIGLFDPDFFISYEDADLNWRAQWAGWTARYVPTALIKHREGVSREIRSRRAEAERFRNEQVRRRLLLEIERERARAHERAAQQRRNLELEIEER